MKTKKIIKAILILVIVVTAAYFYAYTDTCTEGTEFNKSDIREYGFICGEDRLKGIKIGFSGVPEEGMSLHYIIKDMNDNVLASGDFKADNENTVLKTKFDTIKNSGGKEYRLEISTESTADYKLSVSCINRSFRLETMIVSILCIGYLIGLAAVLNRIFRK